MLRHLSIADIELIIALLKHEDFRQDDIPRSFHYIKQECTSLPVFATRTNFDDVQEVVSMESRPTCGSSVSVDVMEVLQRLFVANPAVSHLLKHEPVNVVMNGEVSASLSR